jgi:hypothetical protein
MKEICRSDAFHGGSNVVYIRKVSDGNIDPSLPESRCPLIVQAHIGTHTFAHLQEFIDSRASGPSRCTAYKYLSFAHNRFSIAK